MQHSVGKESKNEATCTWLYRDGQLPVDTLSKNLTALHTYTLMHYHYMNTAAKKNCLLVNLKFACFFVLHITGRPWVD